jgi:hypothetical protein
MPLPLIVLFATFSFVAWLYEEAHGSWSLLSLLLGGHLMLWAIIASCQPLEVESVEKHDLQTLAVADGQNSQVYHDGKDIVNLNVILKGFVKDGYKLQVTKYKKNYCGVYFYLDNKFEVVK